MLIEIASDLYGQREAERPEIRNPKSEIREGAAVPSPRRGSVGSCSACGKSRRKQSIEILMHMITARLEHLFFFLIFPSQVHREMVKITSVKGYST